MLTPQRMRPRMLTVTSIFWNHLVMRVKDKEEEWQARLFDEI